MSMLKTLAGKLSFSHLASASTLKAARADDDDQRDESADDDDKDYKDDQDRSNGDSKKGKRAESDDKDNADDGSDNDERADADDLDDDKKDGKKSKRAKADTDGDDDDERAEDEDDDEDEMHGKSATASARRRERARCATIMGSKYAARNVVLAANLAFNTTMTRTQALAVLRDTPAASPANAGRSGRNPNLGAGGEHAPSSSQAIESRWERTMKKVTGR